MKRDLGRKNKEDMNIKIIKYSTIAIAILTVIVFGVLIYSKKLNEDIKEGTITGEEIASILNNDNSSNKVENTESASTEIGKSINEVTNEVQENKNTMSNNIASKSNSESNKNTEKNILTTNQINSSNTTKQTNSKSEDTAKETESKTESKTELNFEKPVDGDIVRDFAVDNLIYSNTLQEWTTHTGVDIKADKTTVVKSAEAGIVKTIKNDPRYGLTVIVEHKNGYQTVYSNLLTSEFVVEGEKVEKGQSLGTVGNTAAFEIADDAHLHFEILKDSVQVDPNIYLK